MMSYALLILLFICLSNSYEIHLTNTDSSLDLRLAGYAEGVYLSTNELSAEKSISGVLHIPSDKTGCNITETFESGTILFVLRGTCSFTQKAQNAENAKAQAIIIANTVQSLYNTEEDYIEDVCELDCTLGQSSVQNYTSAEMYAGFSESQCSLSTTCKSHVCGIPYIINENTQQNICCIKDSYITMNPSDNKYVSIYAYSVRIQDVNTINKYDKTSVIIKRYVPSSESTQSILFIIIILLIELCAIPFAYYLAENLKEMFKNSPYSNISQDSISYTMTSKDTIYLLVASCFMLLILYLCVVYIKSFVVFVMALFITFYSVFTLYYILSFFLHKLSVMKIFLFKVPPPLPTSKEELDRLAKRNTRFINVVHDFFVYMDLGDLINIIINIVVISCWLGTSSSEAHYFFVDILGILLLLDILMLLRVRSLKTSTIMFSVFFLYDIFMVFITPYLFGNSVMVTVATDLVNPNVESSVSVSNGIRTCSNSYSISLPMALLFKQMNSEGVNALGLGDLAIPGIVLFFLFSYDMDNKSHFYGYGLFGYFVGITLASIFSTTYGPQPALLYLCPSILLCVLLQALLTKSVYKIWNPKPKTEKKEPIEIRETVVDDLDV